jgi:hypothetical protein
METSVLYLLTRATGVQALAVLAVSDDPTDVDHNLATGKGFHPESARGVDVAADLITRFVPNLD